MIFFIVQGLQIDCHFCYFGGSQALLHDAINEIAEHQEFYGPFLSPSWRKELEEYAENKEYDKDVVDLLIHALCNVTQTSCQIITHQGNNIHVEETLLPSRLKRLPSRDIVLCRVGSPYDAAVCSWSSPKDETDWVNSTEVWKSVPKKGPLRKTWEKDQEAAEANATTSYNYFTPLYMVSLNLYTAAYLAWLFRRIGGKTHAVQIYNVCF